MSFDTDADLREFFAGISTIAVVGCSDSTEKPAHYVPHYLQQQGFRVIPVNPLHAEVLGLPAFRSLLDIDVAVDVVNVFRPAAEAAGLARQAVAIGASAFWLQKEIVSAEAAEICRAAGIAVVMDRCLGVAHRDAHLGVGPPRPEGYQGETDH